MFVYLGAVYRQAGFTSQIGKKPDKYYNAWYNSASQTILL